VLTSDLLRARRLREQVLPLYVDATDALVRGLARGLISLFEQHVGKPRGELEAALDALVGERTDYLLHRGLAKLLFDRSTFEIDAKVDPAELRKAVFARASQSHPIARSAGDVLHPVTRGSALAEAAAPFGLSAEEAERALYADLEEALVLRAVEPIGPEALLQRYNVALAQAVLIKASRLTVALAPTEAKRVRQLFRFIKFYGLMHQAHGSRQTGYTITLDGPMSLFQLSSKYGIKLADFLPALLLCPGWTLQAELLWGKERKRALFALRSEDGLVSHYRDTGTYTTEEERAFIERWAALETPWKLEQRPELIDLGGKGVLVPDFVLRHPDGRQALLELVGFWRKGYLESRLELLRQHGPPNLVLAVSQRLRGSEEELAQVPGEVFFFKDVIRTKDVLERIERVARPVAR
jgi:predicted nuclease of restriction endonuclease-like RecB superfamily